MSNGAIAPQTTNTSATWGAGGLGNQQPISQQSTPPFSMGSDRIKHPTEVIAPPLLPNMAPLDAGAAESAKADRIVKSQVTGMGAIAGLGAVIAVAFAIGLPLSRELTFGKGPARPCARRDLKMEDHEHEIVAAERKGDEPSVNWVRHLEHRDVNPFVADDLEKHFTKTWDDFTRADDNFKSASKNGSFNGDLAKIRQSALERVKDLDIPLVLSAPHKDFPYEDARIDSNAPVKSALGSKASLDVIGLFHSHLSKLKATKRLDGDIGRLAQMQIEQSINGLIGMRESANEKLLRHGSRAMGRKNDFDAKLVDLHHTALRQFIARPAGLLK